MMQKKPANHIIIRSSETKKERDTEHSKAEKYDEQQGRKEETKIQVGHGSGSSGKRKAPVKLFFRDHLMFAAEEAKLGTNFTRLHSDVQSTKTPIVPFNNKVILTKVYVRKPCQAAPPR